MLKKILFICLIPLAVSAQDAIYDSYVLAPGWTKLSFVPPESGTYTLPTYPKACLLYTSPSPRDVEESRMPSSA